MSQLIVAAVIGFFVGCLTESAVRDSKLVEKLQKTNFELQVLVCKVAKEKHVELTECGE